MGGRGGHGTARHGTARCGAVRCGRLVQGWRGAAGVSVLEANDAASIDSFIDSYFTAVVLTVCSIKIFDLSPGRAMSRQQRVACTRARARGAARLRHAGRGGAACGCAGRSGIARGRLAEGQRCAIPWVSFFALCACCQQPHTPSSRKLEAGRASNADDLNDCRTRRRAEGAGGT